MMKNNGEVLPREREREKKMLGSSMTSFFCVFCFDRETFIAIFKL